MEITMETGQMAGFGGPLIHYYLLSPAPQFRASIAADRGHSFEEQVRQRAGARLSQRWVRRTDGTLAARWETN